MDRKARDDEKQALRKKSLAGTTQRRMTNISFSKANGNIYNNTMISYVGKEKKK